MREQPRKSRQSRFTESLEVNNNNVKPLSVNKERNGGKQKVGATPIRSHLLICWNVLLYENKENIFQFWSFSYYFIWSNSYSLMLMLPFFFSLFFRIYAIYKDGGIIEMIDSYRTRLKMSCSWVNMIRNVK